MWSSLRVVLTFLCCILPLVFGKCHTVQISYSPLEGYDAETYIISVHGPAGEIGILQSTPDRTVDVDFRLVLEFLCNEFADCSGASDRGFHYAARDRCMAGASPLSLGAAEARDTIAELEDYINGLVVKHNKKFASDETLAQSQDGEEPEYKQQ